MSGSFGDWLLDASDRARHGELGGHQKFTTQFQIKSVTGTNQGMSMNIAPQSLGGARMTNLRFQDDTDGIHVLFSDVLNLAGTVGFYERSLPDCGHRHVLVRRHAHRQDRDEPDPRSAQRRGAGLHRGHQRKPLVPGRPGQVTFDGFYAPVDNQPTTNKAKAGQTIPLKWRVEASSFATSWEDYYRYDTESNGGANAPAPVATVNGYGTRDVDSLIIQARCAAAGPCANVPAQDDGYLIDTSPTRARLSVRRCRCFGGRGRRVDLQQPADHGDGRKRGVLPPGELDPIEVYAANANGLMYHGNGVWQYNWQTPKSLAGKCVEVALSLPR